MDHCTNTLSLLFPCFLQKLSQERAHILDQNLLPILVRHSANYSVSLNLLVDCINDIKLWISGNFLSFNESKTECIMFSAPDMQNGPALSLGAWESYTRSAVKNLGVSFVCSMKFGKQIRNVVNSFFL